MTSLDLELILQHARCCRLMKKASLYRIIQQLKENPHSWVKLWKHHAAQDEANKLNEIAEQRGENFLPRYGGKISSEWMIAKVWQILNEAPDIYEKTDRFVEATDWVTSKLTGNLSS